MLNPTHANFTDGYRERGMRRRLVQELRQKGIADAAVLAAMEAIPRHVFFDQALWEHAYQDKAFPIGGGQTISQPYTVARQSELLALPPGARVLEIGTGSGYQCAILCQMGYKVFSIEYKKELAQRAKAMLNRLGLTPAELKCGDGSLGWPERAPFNGILVTAGAPGVPDALTAQLAPGGRLIIPVGNNATQTMLRITKTADGELVREELGGFRFVPLKGQQGWGR